MEAQCSLPPLYETLCMQKFCQGGGGRLGCIKGAGYSCKAASGGVREYDVVSHDAYM